ncbi:MAG: M24 family metallopeptidase, partial [Acidobacteria bacterium]|nr:M24 family metallopeptidase [Acidobacteriota bacterium]
AGGPADLQAEARDYVGQFAGVYFEVMAEWFRLLAIGRRGGELDELIRNRLPFEKFGIFLNAGHLIHLDEWVSSPIYPGSQAPVHSGMVIQTDVIPFSKIYFSTRVEDGVAIADEALRQKLEEQFPACFDRCRRRREFMRDVLGIELPEEVLPLSNIPGIVPPFFLTPHQVLAMEP